MTTETKSITKTQIMNGYLGDAGALLSLICDSYDFVIQNGVDDDLELAREVFTSKGNPVDIARKITHDLKLIQSMESKRLNPGDSNRITRMIARKERVDEFLEPCDPEEEDAAEYLIPSGNRDKAWNLLNRIRDFLIVLAVEYEWTPAMNEKIEDTQDEADDILLSDSSGLDSIRGAIRSTGEILQIAIDIKRRNLAIEDRAQINQFIRSIPKSC